MLSETALCGVQDGDVLVSSTYQRFERDMADLMRVLRQTPAQILWRSYAPTHFGGESGAYVSGQDYQVSTLCKSLTYFAASTVDQLRKTSGNTNEYEVTTTKAC